MVDSRAVTLFMLLLQNDNLSCSTAAISEFWMFFMFQSAPMECHHTAGKRPSMQTTAFSAVRVSARTQREDLSVFVSSCLSWLLSKRGLRLYDLPELSSSEQTISQFAHGILSREVGRQHCCQNGQMHLLHCRSRNQNI